MKLTQKSDVITEGTFLDDNGNILTYTNWRAGEPNNADFVEDAVSINLTLSTEGRWYDDPSSKLYETICVYVDRTKETLEKSTFFNLFGFGIPI